MYRLIPELNDLDVSRFWAKVNRADNDDCWLWAGAKISAGYGHMNLRGQDFMASRLAFYIANKIQPEGYVCHSCDNPPCVNPAHLWLGTPKDNVVDMVAKGRAAFRKSGVTHCKRGHEFTPENTVRNGATKRGCRECRNQRKREARVRQSAPPLTIDQHIAYIRKHRGAGA